MDILLHRLRRYKELTEETKGYIDAIKTLPSLKTTQPHIILAHCRELGRLLPGIMKEYSQPLYRNIEFRKYWKRQHTLETIARRSVYRRFIYLCIFV